MLFKFTKSKECLCIRLLAATANFLWTSDETRSAPKNGALGRSYTTPSAGRLDGFPYHRMRARPILRGNTTYFFVFTMYIVHIIISLHRQIVYIYIIMIIEIARRKEYIRRTHHHIYIYTYYYTSATVVHVASHQLDLHTYRIVYSHACCGSDLKLCN